MRRKLGDRRIRPRYDIVGDLWGTVQTALRLPLRDVGHGGALIESRVALAAESVHRLIFDCEGTQAAAQVRVKHVRPTLSERGERVYLVGVEFLSYHPQLGAQIERWMAAGSVEAAATEG